MHGDEGGGAEFDRLTEDFAAVNEAIGRGAFGDFHPLEQSVFAVEAEHPEALDLGSDGEGPEVAGHLFGAVEDGRFAAVLLFEDALGKLHDGEQLEGLDPADAANLHEVLCGPAQKHAEGTGGLEELAGHADHIHATRAAAEDHREELPVTQRFGTEPFEPFLWPLAGDHVAHPGGAGRIGWAGVGQSFSEVNHE